MQKLVDHIKRNYNEGQEFKLGKYYCSIIAIIQSSGYGKSKLMERLGSRTPTFYSSFQHGIGFPRESFFLVNCLEELDIIVNYNSESITTPCYMNNVSTAVYIYILRILFILLKNSQNAILQKSFQIDDIENERSFSKYNATKMEIFQFLFKDLRKLVKVVSIFILMEIILWS